MEPTDRLRRRRSVFLQKETGESDNIAIFMSTVNQPIHPMFEGREGGQKKIQPTDNHGVTDSNPVRLGETL